MTDLTVEKCVEFLRGALERGEVERACGGVWHPAGCLFIDQNTDLDDIRTKPRRVEGWVNVGGNGFRDTLWPTETAARDHLKLTDASLDDYRQVYVCEPE